MTALVEFVRARLDEDERYARLCDAAFPGPWEVIDRGHSATVKADAPYFPVVTELAQEAYVPAHWLGDHLAHIARQQPARVLADCAAKRRILELHPVLDGHMPSPALRALALPYADHADYDQAWVLE